VTRRTVPLLVLVVVAGTSACEEKSYDPPDPESRVELADSLYSPALFDTIEWPSPEERAYAGNLVYADYCRRCHGPVGVGGTVEVAGRTLEVPSLVRADWGFEAHPEEVRRRIFTGHTGGMPSLGVSRLTPREVDAAAYYVLELLRPEMTREAEPYP
jgi:mono/diheme cytochrome c family protein